MAFLFAAEGRTKRTPTSEIAKPMIEVTILPETLAVRCNPNRTTSQPPSASATPIKLHNRWLRAERDLAFQRLDFQEDR